MQAVYLDPGVLLWRGICVKARGRPSACSCLIFSARMQISRQHAPCPQLSSSVLGCCPPEKGSRGAGVAVGFRGAGQAHPSYVIICRLVPDPGGVRCSLGCEVGHSQWSLIYLFCYPINVSYVLHCCLYLSLELLSKGGARNVKVL